VAVGVAGCCATASPPPHDPYGWDLQVPPLLTSANGLSVVIDGGQAGILVELNP
jgi:hypothetical protein